ncbi:MAG: hypothetical protein IKH97_04910 [Bacteroidales bacterium]|nr:hypothetical protein [Bacteroidales bacterium]
MQRQDSIRRNLDQFIRKYYKNRMIKGIIYALALLLSLFLVMALLEHFGYFGTTVRAILFWCYLLASVCLLVYYVFVPLAKMFRLGKVISYEEAAKIIGRHFPEVQDKLLNLLQLQENGDVSSDDLLAAAIEQKTAQLKPVPFQNAVDIKSNRKYLKYLAIPVVVILLLLLVSPSVITGSSHRIAHYNTQFEKPAPFSFVVENPSLEVAQQEDFELHVLVDGNAVPAEAFINIEGNVYRMRQVDKTHYSYQFKTVQRSCDFHLEAAGVTSTQYRLTVFPKPAVVDFRVLLSYPAYTLKLQETLLNEGDLVVPQGTSVRWLFQTKDVDTLYFFVNEDVKRLVPDDNGRVSLTIRALQSFTYGFAAANHYAPVSDTLGYAVTAIEDLSPMIAVVEMHDSLVDDRLFFHGRIKDDYGFTKLEFKLVKTNVQDTSKKEVLAHGIGITKETVQEFNYSTDLSDIELGPGDKLVYYFEVWDNDGIHGPKSATSQQFELQVPTEKELDNILDRNSNEAQERAQQSMSELKKMQQDINELMRKLVDKKEFDWQDKKDLQELAKKQQQVKEMLQQMQQQLNENKKLEQKYRDHSEQLMEKQRELERLMNEVMNEEMKQMMEQIDKMMQELDKKKVQEQLEQLKLDNQDLEKQLDQNIELMKRLEMEKKVEEAVRKTEELAEKQRELSDKTEAAKSKDDKDKLLKEQQKLSEQYDQLKQELNQIQQDYKKIDNDLNFKLDKELMDKIDQNQQGAEKSLEKGKSKDASKQQKEASEQLDQLSEQLAEAQVDLEQQDLAEDAEQIRRLLKNLVQLSFNQESLIGKVRNTFIQDPQYQSIIVGQNKIKDDFRGVEDSLRAIAKRQLNVARVINKYLGEVNSNVARSMSELLNMNQTFYGTYKNSQASTSMQYAMTAFNNLALVMAESLDQMQNQMRQNQQKKQNSNCKNQGMKKSGNCSNPGKGKPSAKSMKQMQQELNKQMESLKKQLDKQGKDSKPNGRKKIGDKSSMQMSEEFARMAAQQEMIRRMMQEYGQEMKQGDAGNAKLAREIDQMMKQMEQTENDLVNKVITQQTINRQQQIMTRMLEHEKAEMQREKEERRESREGKEMGHQPSASDLEQFKRMQEKNMELFRTVPPTLSPYYKAKVNDYFYKF